MATTASPSGTASRSHAAARRGLVVLTLVNLVNYLDRFIVPPLIESLKREPGLALTDARAGLLVSSFIVVYMLASPVFGRLGDRFSRTKLIAFGVAVWSAATVLGGLADSYASLFVARAAVGIGEAAYGTIAPTLLADYFPKRQRGRVFAVFFAAMPVGSALGYILGGVMTEALGWRAAFFVAGAPGLLLALLVLTLLDPKRGGTDEEADAGASEEPTAHHATGGARSLWEPYVTLARNPVYVATVLGYAAWAAGVGGISGFLPSFLQRERGLEEGEASIAIGLILVVTGFVGTFAGGFLGDWLLRRTQAAYLWLSGVATLAAAPFALVAVVAREPALYWTGIFVSELFLFASTGPVNSTIVNVVRPDLRATAMATSILVMHALGDVPSPPLIGVVSDTHSLGTALLIVPAAIAVSGAIWTFAAMRKPSGTVTTRSPSGKEPAS